MNEAKTHTSTDLTIQTEWSRYLGAVQRRQRERKKEIVANNNSSTSKKVRTHNVTLIFTLNIEYLSFNFVCTRTLYTCVCVACASRVLNYFLLDHVVVFPRCTYFRLTKTNVDFSKHSLLERLYLPSFSACFSSITLHFIVIALCASCWLSSCFAAISHLVSR